MNQRPVSIRYRPLYSESLFTDRSEIPDDVHRPPGETGTEGGQNEFVAGFEGVFEIVETDRNGGTRGVAVVLNVDENFFHRETGFLSNGFDDAEICLMGNEIGDVVGCQIVAFHDIERRAQHVGNGMFVDSAAFLIDIVPVVVDGFVRSGIGRAAAFHHEVGQTRTVDVEDTVNDTDTFFLGRLKKDSTRAVAKKRTGSAVFVVGHG